MDNEVRWAEIERRRSVRWHERTSAEFILFCDMIIPDFPAKREGLISNFSSTGVFAKIKGIKEEWVAGLLSGATKIGVKMKLPKMGEEIKALAKLIWIRRFQEGEDEHTVGLDFMDITTATRDILRTYIIDSYLKKESVD